MFRVERPVRSAHANSEAASAWQEPQATCYQVVLSYFGCVRNQSAGISLACEQPPPGTRLHFTATYILHNLRIAACHHVWQG